VTDPTYPKRIGVNVDDLLVLQPDAGEQAIEIAARLEFRGPEARRSLFSTTSPS
jgi:RecA/RadA recombinase